MVKKVFFALLPAMLSAAAGMAQTKLGAQCMKEAPLNSGDYLLIGGVSIDKLRFLYKLMESLHIENELNHIRHESRTVVLESRDYTDDFGENITASHTMSRKLSGNGSIVCYEEESVEQKYEDHSIVKSRKMLMYIWIPAEQYMERINSNDN
jgi:hypothetical protein